METITITLTEPLMRKLKERAKEAKVAPEELLRAGVEEWLQQPQDAFSQTVTYVLQKNAELYRRLEAGSSSEEYCCDMMQRQIEITCDIHADCFECPDCLVTYAPRSRQYGLIVHDGGHSSIRIHYCPWCGQELSEAKPNLALRES